MSTFFDEVGQWEYLGSPDELYGHSERAIADFFSDRKKRFVADAFIDDGRNDLDESALELQLVGVVGYRLTLSDDNDHYSKALFIQNGDRTLTAYHSSWTGGAMLTIEDKILQAAGMEGTYTSRRALGQEEFHQLVRMLLPR